MIVKIVNHLWKKLLSKRNRSLINRRNKIKDAESSYENYILSSDNDISALFSAISSKKTEIKQLESELKNKKNIILKALDPTGVEVEKQQRRLQR